MNRSLTTFEHRLMLMLSQGETPSIALYELAQDESRVRKNLRLMIKRGWVILTKKEKMDDGPGAPMNFYKLTDTGILILHNHEEELESLR